ncbi:MAG: succinate dehydrogenase, hydrophobic membrane anchor protein [Gammaproteobacteria bacterium]|nr:succinate dehydrogenase, hydrophobic membrane anchor protein [Gammaproteobacteria bacterium]
MSKRLSSGLRAWVVQRFSAIYMAVFLLYIVISYMMRESTGFESWTAWVSNPINNVAVGLFFFALLLHAWVGCRDIVMDYVKPFSLRMLKLVALATILLAMGLWVLLVLLKAVNY